MAYDRKRVDHRRKMTVEKRIEMTEAALDSLAPAIHDLYECLRHIQEILSTDRLDMHVQIEKAIKRTLDRYDREWNGKEWDKDLL